MDIELLKTFLELNSTRHFGKAAENLYLTQSAVSARVKQLESIVGGAVFERHRNNLQLTNTGERLVPHAEGIINAWDRAKNDLALQTQQKISFAIGASSGLWDVLVQDALHTVFLESPEAMLRAEVHSSEASVRLLVERTLDLALLFEPSKTHELVSEPVTLAELVLVSTRKGLDVQSALAERYIAMDWGLAFQISFSQNFPNTPPAILHTNQSRIALDFMARSGGSAYLPHRLVASRLGLDLFLVADAPVIARKIYACYHKQTPHQSMIDSVVAIIKDQEKPSPEASSASILI